MTNVKNLPFSRRIEEHSLIHIFKADSSALHIFTVSVHKYLCLCVFRNAPVCPRFPNLQTVSLRVCDFLFWREQVLCSCRRPPRYVPYKGTYVPYDGTYGAPDQGQMLDVWGWHPDDVNPKVKIHRSHPTDSQNQYCDNEMSKLCLRLFVKIVSFSLDSYWIRENPLVGV